MKIARVVRQVVATHKHSAFKGLKLFLVKPLALDGTEEGSTYVAVDCVHAGVGEKVLVLQEGSSARIIVGEEKAPIRSVIVGIIDHVDRI